MRLSQLQTGQSGTIVKVAGHGAFRKRIMEMGFVRGVQVEVVRNAPLRDPVEYSIMGYNVSLRREEAQRIEVTPDGGQRAETDGNGAQGSRDGRGIRRLSRRIGRSRRSTEHSATEGTAPREAGYYGPTDKSPDPRLRGGRTDASSPRPDPGPQAGRQESEATHESGSEGLRHERRHTEKSGAVRHFMRKITRPETEAPGRRPRTITVALVGNPNCGKTSLFNLAAGAHEHVGNYSGVTVDAREGRFDFRGYRIRLVDLPGTYSLSAYSPEELYVRRYIADRRPDVIINVADASNLERNLYLTAQLLDMERQTVVALNMYDELERSGDRLDYRLLGTLLGVPVTPTVCRENIGVERLLETVVAAYEGRYPAQPRRVNYGREIEQAIETVGDAIAEQESPPERYPARYLAIKLLEADAEAETHVKALPGGATITAVRDKAARRLTDTLGEDCETALTDARYGFVAGALRETYTPARRRRRTRAEKIDAVLTHRIWGFPLFLLFLWIMFQATYTLGEWPMRGIEWCVGWLGSRIDSIMQPGPLRDLLADGIVGGVGGVLAFLPNILILYLFISVMEDTGYMARAAFIMDKLMHKMGLHGKSFIPLVMGFGCNVPAIMATRTIESRKSRLVTMLVNPLISCSARLPVYILLIGIFFPRRGGLALLSLYVIGIALAVLAARILSRVLIRGSDMPFVMELPPYRMPTARAIGRHTWEKGAQYLRKIGGIIMIASVIIWFLGYYPRPTQEATEATRQENSYLGRIGKAVAPLMEPLGFDWRMDIGLIAGAGAKELVASTLLVLYTPETAGAESASSGPMAGGGEGRRAAAGEATAGQRAGSMATAEQRAGSMATAGQRAAGSGAVTTGHGYRTPEGVTPMEAEGIAPAKPQSGTRTPGDGNSSPAQEETRIQAMGRTMGITPLTAYCYLLFISIYFPCLASLAAIRQESGSWKWALFTAAYTTALAWIVSFIVAKAGALFL